MQATQAIWPSPSPSPSASPGLSTAAPYPKLKRQQHWQHLTQGNTKENNWIWKIWKSEKSTSVGETHKTMQRNEWPRERKSNASGHCTLAAAFAHQTARLCPQSPSCLVPAAPCTRATGSGMLQFKSDKFYCRSVTVLRCISCSGTSSFSASFPLFLGSLSFFDLPFQQLYTRWNSQLSWRACPLHQVKLLSSSSFAVVSCHRITTFHWLASGLILKIQRTFI